MAWEHQLSVKRRRPGGLAWSASWSVEPPPPPTVGVGASWSVVVSVVVLVVVVVVVVPLLLLLALSLVVPLPLVPGETGGFVGSIWVRAARGARDPQREGRRRFSRGLPGCFRQHEQQRERGEQSRGEKAATPRGRAIAGCGGHGARCRARRGLPRDVTRARSSETREREKLGRLFVSAS